MNDTPTPAEVDSILCPAAKDPAVRWFIFAAMLIGYGFYTIYDHYIQGNYPYPDPYKLNPYLTYLFNHYNPYVLIPPGLIAMVMSIRYLRRKLIADGEGIGYAGTDRIPWNEIRNVDASKLQSKGILYLRHGGGKTLKLASWKLQNFRDLVAFVERHVPPEAMGK